MTETIVNFLGLQNDVYVVNAICTFVSLVSISFILWGISHEHQSDIQKQSQFVSKSVSKLDEKWTTLEHKVTEIFDKMSVRIAKLEAENNKLRLLIHKNVAKQEEDLALNKCQTEKYIDAMFVSLDGELTNKLSQVETKLDDVDVVVRNEARELDEKMSTIEELAKANDDLLVKQSGELAKIMSKYNDIYKSFANNIDKMEHECISLKTELDERVDIVVVGVYDYSTNSPAIVCSNASNLLTKDILKVRPTHDYDLGGGRRMSDGTRAISVDLHSLKYLPNVKKIDVKILYYSVATFYVIDQTNILDNARKSVLRPRLTIVEEEEEHVGIPQLFQNEGSKKVIQYIGSIRPDIILTWGETPI